MPKDDKGMLNELAILQDKFASNLDSRIGDIASTLQELRDVSKQEEFSFRLKNLQSLAHKLSGSVGSYGFAEVSRICQQIDIITLECDADSKMMATDRYEALENLVVQLRENEAGLN